MNKKIFFVFMFLLFASSMLFAFGAKEKDEPAETIQVTGVVRLTGTSLFPELVISGEEARWHIAKDEMEKLFELQHQTVTLEAVETVTEIFFANGQSAGIRRELSRVKIINVAAEN